MSITNILKKINHRDTKLFPNLSKKTTVFAILLLSFLTILLSRQVFAATADDFKAKQTAITQGNNQESWMNEALISNSMSLIQAIGGSLPDDLLNGKTTMWAPAGMIGFTNKAITSLYIPPASGVEYIAQTFNTFLGKPAYAQDSGFQSLTGLMDIWKRFRNATYVLFSVFFIIIGIMIMLRVKISPQAVLSIQSSIPKIITTLILITFSYAIVGLLIDLSYLLQAILLTIINNPDITSIANEIKNPDLFGHMFGLLPVGTILALSSITGFISTLIGAPTYVGIFLNILSGFGLGTMALAALVLLILTLVFFLKFLFGLAKCYIVLILKIVIGPFEIALGALPNSKMGFGSWLTSIIANLAVFPITIIFLILLKTITTSINSKDIWIPSILSSLDRNGEFLSAIIGLAGFMLVSKLPTLIPEFIFQIKPSPFGKAIGENMSNNFVAATGRFGWGTVKAGVGKNISDRFGSNRGDKVDIPENTPTTGGTTGGGNPGGGNPGGGNPGEPAVLTQLKKYH